MDNIPKNQRVQIWKRFMVSLAGFLILSSGYAEELETLKIKVEETAGLSRDLEYLEVDLPLSWRDCGSRCSVSVFGENNTSIPTQIIETDEKNSGGLKLVFPVSIGALESKEYLLKKKGQALEANSDLETSGSELDLVVENKSILADFSGYVGVNDERLVAGHLGNLVLKEFGDIRLARNDPKLKIHWSPNFKREDYDYKTMAHMTSIESLSISKGPLRVALSKSGWVPGYEEIALRGEYRFYAGLPFFVFSSEMAFREDSELELLRNDEMTMDRLFTHVVFPRPDGEVVDLPLYDDASSEALEKEPIAYDAPWLYFYNKNESYAFGSIRVSYDNRNRAGGESPTQGKYTSITTTKNDGRYWDRKLIYGKSLYVPKGSRYRETTAYIVFKVDENDLAGQIEYYRERLCNPLKVSYADES
ncbi:hypothetical protein MLD52_02310 [Puniceicoccaceae bacterium K14]|nr:hypothetical protein [Puniceicoccaceae bacterium K14]